MTSRQRQPVHEPGRVAVDLAVMFADGGEAIADLACYATSPTCSGR